MSTHQSIDKICAAVLALTLLLTILFVNGEAIGIQVIIDEDAEAHSDSSWFTANDLNGEWDSSRATVIKLNGDYAEISGSGAYAYDGNVVITNGGSYVLSGTLTDGSIVVDAYASSKVWILLNGVTVNCSDDACLIVDQADKVFLTLADGSENSFTSGDTYAEEALADNTDGVIFSHDDLTINGSGSLTATGGWKHGIAANDDLVITGGKLVIEAVQDAIHANDSMRICNADLILTAGDDGISVSNTGGYLYLESGDVEIHAQGDGINTMGDIDIVGGNLTIYAGDDGIHSDTAVRISGGSIQIPECYEGIEAVTIDLSGGDIEIHPTDDGLNANGGSGDLFGMMGGPQPGGMPGGHGSGMGTEEQAPDMEEAAAGQMSGERPSGPDPAQTDGPVDEQAQQELERNGMSSFAETELQGIGITLTRTEDGNLSAENGETMETWVHISGGTLTIVNESGRDSDGIDSNGDILISGGVIRVSLTNGGTNSALDFASENGGVCEITGGEIVACGSYSMAEGFDSASTQCSVLYNISAGAEAGTTVCLENADGNILISYEVPCSFSSVNLSCPQLQLGETYLMVIGDNVEAITLEETAASYGDAQSSMFGGNMNWGGMQDRGTFGGFGGGHHRNEDMLEGSFDSTGMPEPPDGTTPPEPPGDMMNPEGGFPPDGAQAAGERPEMADVGFNQDLGAFQNSEMQGDARTGEESGIEGDPTVDIQTGPDRETLIWTGLSAITLILGLLFAFRYRKHR